MNDKTANINFHHFKRISDLNSSRYRSCIVEDEDTKIKYVEKRFHMQCISEHDQKLFISKTSKASKISTHPSLLRIINFSLHDINDDSYPTIITEYMPNRSLLDVMDKKIPSLQYQNLTGTQKYIILLGTAIGMRHLYFQNIIHSDLILNNILLDKNLYPHISNYGFSNKENDELTYNQKVKWESYDAFSFSLIAYELITGIRPKHDNYHFYNSPPDIQILKSEWLKLFFQKCWSNEIRNRPKFYEIVDEFTKKRDEFQLEFGLIEENDVTIYLNIIINYLDVFAKQVKESADQGDISSMLLCGKLLFFGYGINMNKIEAARYFKLAIDKGDTNSMFNYGIMLEKGEGIQKDTVEAARFFKMAADQGHPSAMYNYGVILEKSGKEMKALASHYYKMAANLGNDDAMYNYGVMLEQGDGIEQNKEEAARYYKMAADQGDIDSMFNYAVMLEKGEGIKRDIHEAVKYYKMAADQGDVDSMFNCGVILKKGDGIESNIKEAALYLKKAADRGDADAMFNYAILLKKGEGIVKNLQEAASYFKMAADQGNSSAMYNYGIMLGNAEGIPSDIFEAAHYFKMAADNGDIEAMFNYGIMLYNGEGVASDKKEAVKYYKKAAEQGNLDAMFNFGQMLKNGDGIEADKKEAAYYLKMAADLGHIDASQSYEALLREKIEDQ